MIDQIAIVGRPGVQKSLHFQYREARVFKPAQRVWFLHIQIDKLHPSPGKRSEAQTCHQSQGLRPAFGVGKDHAAQH